MWKKISVVIDIILVLLIIFVGYVQIEMLVTRGNNHGVPKVFGQSILYVGTNSMDDGTSHGIPPGTAVIINTVSPSSIKASTPIYDEVDKTKIIDYEKDGDVVTFYWSPIRSVDTHRVIAVDYDEVSKKYTFTTMGDNPEAHEKKATEKWGEENLVGKVVMKSRPLGQFLEISSPEAAAFLSARDGKNHIAWFFPVAIFTPIVLISASYIVQAIVKSSKEKKAREAEINRLMIENGVDMNDEEAVTLFRTKEEIRLDIKEEMEKEYEKAKKQIMKEMEKQQKDGKR